MKRILYIVSLAAFLCTAGCGNHDQAKDSAARVLPRPSGRVNDFEELYTETQKRQLDSMMAGIEQATTIQFCVVTLGQDLCKPYDSFDSLTLKIARYWGVGRKDLNNGISINISKRYRRIRIWNGTGISPVLTDSMTGLIVQDIMIPEFRKNSYYEGTRAGIEAIMDIMSRQR